MPQDQKFEIPQELRQLAEENVERARQLYVQFMDGVGQTMAAWSSASSDVVAPGYREVQEHAVKLANENADAAFRLAKDVAQAKDLHELIDLQTRYVQSQMKWYAEQTQEFGRLMTRALGDMKKAQSPLWVLADITALGTGPLCVTWLLFAINSGPSGVLSSNDLIEAPF